MFINRQSLIPLFLGHPVVSRQIRKRMRKMCLNMKKLNAYRVGKKSEDPRPLFVKFKIFDTTKHILNVCRVRSTNADTGTKAVTNQSTFRLCKSQQYFMRRVCLHWKQVNFGSEFHCQNYETISFLRTLLNKKINADERVLKNEHFFFKIILKKIILMFVQ